MAQNRFYQHPEWSKNANIYEVNIRQYTKEGTFKAFEASLPRLKKMGVDILWLMPIFPIGEKERKGLLGSYYAVKDYRAVNPEFGTEDDLRHLVGTAHKMDFKVILDWVANHSSPDNPLTTSHPDWYKHDSVTGKIIPPVADWSDVAAFDYTNAELRDYQIESMKYWIRSAEVDGFRCDVAMMVPLQFWKQVRGQLDKEKKIFLLAEAERPEFHESGFDMTYTWDFHHLLNDIAKGNKKAADIEAYYKTHDAKYQKSDYRMNFTSNHDENSWNGSEYERMGDAAEAMAVLCATYPGMPLVYSGQESALKKRLKFFDKDSIEWGNYSLGNFYSKLLHLKTNNAALWNGTDGGTMDFEATGNPNLLIFSRVNGQNQVFVMLNLSAKMQECKIDVKKWAGIYSDVFTNTQSVLQESYKLQPWSYKVLVAKSKY